MIENETYVRFYRKIKKWEWYTDLATFKLFIHLIIEAQYADKNFRGRVIKRGQLLTGRKRLSLDTGLSEQQVRTALEHLKSTNEITIEPTSRYSIITLTNYDLYQYKDQPANQQSTNNQPTTNQQLTTYNNDNKDNKDNKENNNISKGKIKNFSPPQTKFIIPSLDEVKKYCLERKNNVNAEHFIDFYSSKGWYVGKNKMKDWKAAVRTWEQRDNSPPAPTNESPPKEIWSIGDYLKQKGIH